VTRPDEFEQLRKALRALAWPAPIERKFMHLVERAENRALQAERELDMLSFTAAMQAADATPN